MTLDEMLDFTEVTIRLKDALRENKELKCKIKELEEKLAQQTRKGRHMSPEVDLICTAVDHNGHIIPVYKLKEYGDD